LACDEEKGGLFICVKSLSFPRAVVVPFLPIGMDCLPFSPPTLLGGFGIDMGIGADEI